ncbi:MAG: hypothetical protein QXK12_06835 [Candidatus Nezhaarchaeales archaeon]
MKEICNNIAVRVMIGSRGVGSAVRISFREIPRKHVMEKVRV